MTSDTAIYPVTAAKKIRTPELDKLAASGMRLTHFYSGSSVCTPSRMALLTGCYPARLGWPSGVMGHKMSPKTGLNPSIPTIAEIFKAANYRTALSGKWHLGEAPGFLPHDRGFDESFCILSSNNQTKKLWRNDKLVIDILGKNRAKSREFLLRHQDKILWATDESWWSFQPEIRSRALDSRR
jgi:arylsulfatase A-like enzyme